jgi:hypothetical protein
MNLPKYPVFATEETHTYGFYSEGPMGRIRKFVFYQKIGTNLFNLGFGDWDEERRQANDSNRSNNGDRDKVLATVASTALNFTDQFPDARLFAEGSTPARTRLYQMGISHNLLEINKKFEVKGFIGEQWEIFQHGRNYAAFLITRK